MKSLIFVALAVSGQDEGSGVTTDSVTIITEPKSPLASLELLRPIFQECLAPLSCVDKIGARCEGFGESCAQSDPVNNPWTFTASANAPGQGLAHSHLRRAWLLSQVCQRRRARWSRESNSSARPLKVDMLNLSYRKMDYFFVFQSNLPLYFRFYHYLFRNYP